MVQIFVKAHHEKRGKWSQNMLVLAYDITNRTVTVPGSKGRTVSAAIEDIRTAVCENELATAVPDAINEIDRNVDGIVDLLESEAHCNDEDTSDHPAGTRAVSDEELDCSAPNVSKVGDRIEVY